MTESCCNTGWTSFTVCGKLRRLVKVKKVLVAYFSALYIHLSLNSRLTFGLVMLQVGHAGTLDPMATGLLIVCVGKATKLADR